MIRAHSVEAKFPPASGQEFIRTALVLERATARRVKHHWMVYANRGLKQQTCYSELFNPAIPLSLLAHSYSDVLMTKYVDAMFLYRQKQMWKRTGVELKHDTMAY